MTVTEKNKTKNILLTGATGFLGSNLLKAFVQSGYQVVILKRSFSDTERIKELIGQTPCFNIDQDGIKKAFASYKFDTIIHCATSYGRKSFEPLSLIQSNLIFPLQLLAIGCQQGVSCFINTDTILDKRVNIYSLSKEHFREWLWTYYDKMTCVNITLEHFYGPYDDKSKFTSFIISEMLANRDSIDLTDGEQERDFIYIDDVIKAFMVVFENRYSIDKNLTNIEVGTNKPIKIKDFVQMVKRLTNSRSKLNFGALPYRKNETMSIKVDTEIIRSLGWKPEISIVEGLTKTIQKEKEKLTT